jgi:hypothetical protein
MTDILFNGQKVINLNIVTKPEEVTHDVHGRELIVTEEIATLTFSYIDEKTGETKTHEFWIKGHS